MSNLKVPNGGRSTSQISIYDYPEHLNPFYEDENHKRIRFWRLGKNKYNNGETSRRGSFSLSGLKEMWAFKSFRLKKKSSNLGINKTSESPPPLRRALASDENHYGTYDPRMRHTTGINTLNDNFLRNTPYRASLQDMRFAQKMEYNNNNNNNNNNALGFERNNRYRSTIQTTMRNKTSPNSEGLSPQAPPRRYVYGGSVTPQPRLRSSDYSDDYSGISRGSSQISISSKNPFEEDDDVVIGKIPSSDSDTSTKRVRHMKKKRRAPAPPIPIPKIITEESRTIENDQDAQKENAQITNLAVEIQNFVKSVDRCSENEEMKDIKENEIVNHEVDNLKIVEEQDNINKTIVEEVSHNLPETPPCTENTTNKTENTPGENLNKNLKEDEEHEIQIKSGNENLKEDEEHEIQIKNENENLKVDKEHEIQIKNENENLKVDEEHEIQIKNEKPIENSNLNETTSSNITYTNNSNNELALNTSDQENTLTISEELPLSNTELKYVEQPLELKITESVEDLSERSEKSQKSEISNEIIKDISYIPLNNEEDEIKQTNLNHKTNGYDDPENQKNRRRSVREIIESINRNQKLLKINQIENNSIDEDSNNKNNIQAPPRKKNNFKNKESLEEVSTEPEDDIQNIIDEMEKIAKIEREKDVSILTDDIIQKLTDKINNNDDDSDKQDDIFKKCEVKKEINRESSPISSNLDWNPVPKPKRTKKLSIDSDKNE